MKDADPVNEITNNYYIIAVPKGGTEKYLRIPAFETTDINIGYLSQDEFGQRIAVGDLADYIKRLEAVCKAFFPQSSVPEDLDLIVVVKPAGRSRVWFVSSGTAEGGDQREPLRKALEGVSAPVTKGGPVGFDIQASIAGGTGNRSDVSGPPPLPKDWSDELSKHTGTVHFDDVVGLVWPD